MDPIVDRTMETLAASDLMVVLTRRALLQAARAYADHRKLPAVLDDPGLCRGVRGGDIVVPAGTNWLKAYDETIAGIFGGASRDAAE
jgi:hypothetical protein